MMLPQQSSGAFLAPIAGREQVSVNQTQAICCSALVAIVAMHWPKYALACNRHALRQYHVVTMLSDV